MVHRTNRPFVNRWCHTRWYNTLTQPATSLPTPYLPAITVFIIIASRVSVNSQLWIAMKPHFPGGVRPRWTRVEMSACFRQNVFVARAGTLCHRALVDLGAVGIREKRLLAENEPPA